MNELTKRVVRVHVANELTKEGLKRTLKAEEAKALKSVLKNLEEEEKKYTLLWRKTKEWKDEEIEGIAKIAGMNKKDLEEAIKKEQRAQEAKKQELLEFLKRIEGSEEVPMESIVKYINKEKLRQTALKLLIQDQVTGIELLQMLKE